MARQALREGNISEDTIRKALTDCKGDIFLSASMLGCTGRELDWYIRRSDSLQHFASTIAKVKNNPEFERMSTEQFNSELATLSRTFKIEAIEVIHQLATMDYDSAALAEVKLKAAIQLRGSVGEVSQEDSSILRELNEIYQAQAPRLKSIRAVQIEFESGTQAAHPQNHASAASPATLPRQSRQESGSSGATRQSRPRAEKPSEKRSRPLPDA